MWKLILSVTSVFMTTLAFAQTGKGKITLTILNEQKAPVDAATVELLRNKDSSLVKTAVSDKAGLIEFDNGV